MKALFPLAILFMVSFGCSKQPTLPPDSKFNVTSRLNDSLWYGTGKVLRLRNQGQTPENVKTFNLVIFTDIDYPGMGGGPNPNTSNGCLDPECTKTQSLVIYNIPLKKRRYNIGKLNRSARVDNYYAALSYIGNAGGLTKRYTYQNDKPGWVKITKIDKASGTVNGNFNFLFRDDKTQKTKKELPETARFSDGRFRIKITDVLLR